MALMVLRSEDISQEALPIAALAAQMRLADGYDTVPGQQTRLAARLRAAIGLLERRLGIALLDRSIWLSGRIVGGDRFALPVRPVTRIERIESQVNGVTTLLEAAEVEDGFGRPVLHLPNGAVSGTQLDAKVRGGYADWASVPDALAQATLLVAEALDAGETELLAPVVETLIAPFRRHRLGAVC